MTKEEILHLGRLSRIKLSDEEVEHFGEEISAILEYVSAVSSIVGDPEETKHPGARYNVFRPDEVTNEPNQFTDDLLKEMPETEGRFMKVKKILENNG